MAHETDSQASFETANRKAAKKRNLPKPSTKVSPPAEQPVQKEVGYLIPAHCTVSLYCKNLVLWVRWYTEEEGLAFKPRCFPTNLKSDRLH